MTDAVTKALEGCIDMHCHSGPSPFPRRFLHYEAAKDAYERLKMRAIVVKSHHHNTVMDVHAMANQLTEIPTKVYGGIALNSMTGGLNPHAVRMSLRMGGKVVWWPTISSGRHIECHAESRGFPTTTIPLTVERIDVVDDSGALTDEAIEVIDVIRDEGAVLNGGHMYPEYIRTVFGEARDRGINKLVISHPNFVIGADPEACDEYVRIGAFIEHEVGMYNPNRDDPHFTPDVLMDWISRHGPEHIVLASDAGQKSNPSPVDAYIGTSEALLDLGLPVRDLQQMTIYNPARLLDIEL